MAVTLRPVVKELVRSAITFEEAQRLLARGCQPESEWRSLSQDEQIFRSFRARQSIALALFNGDLTAYIWSPSDCWYCVPRDFWRIAGMTIQDIVERAAFADVYSDCERFLDAPDDIEGQPFVVWNEDIYQHLAELPTIAGVLLDEIAGIKFSEAPDSITHDEKDASPDLRGSLPSSASPSARRFEKLAHRAATIIRSDGVSAQKAFATLAQHETSNFTDIDITSLPNAIRRSFQIMYDKRGLPLKN